MFTKDQIKSIHIDLNEMLQLLGKKHNVRLTTGTLRYGANDLRVKITGQVRTSDEVVAPEDEYRSQIVSDFNEFSTVFGIPKNALNQNIVRGTSVFKIIGLKPNNRKYPLIVQGSRGGRYKILVTDKIIDQLKNN